MAQDNPNDGGGPQLPPYVSFQSIKTAIAQFKEHELPDRIDRSVLTNFSGAVGSQILTALKFLGLTDGSGHPTTAMKTLVASWGTDSFATNLAGVVKTAYGPIFDLNLASCSPSQFTEKFKKTYVGADEVIRKSITFFLNACSEAAIPVSSFIMKARKPRSAPAKRKTPRQSASRGSTKEEDGDDDGEEGTDDNPPPPPPPSNAFLDRLMEKFPPLDPAWPDEVKAKWFDSFAQLMARADEKK